MNCYYVLFTWELMLLNIIQVDLWFFLILTSRDYGMNSVEVYFHCMREDMWTHLIFVSCREKELAAVKINAADVDIISKELEVCFLLHNFFASNPCASAKGSNICFSLNLKTVGQEGGWENPTRAQGWCCCCHPTFASLESNQETRVWDFQNFSKNQLHVQTSI